MSDEVCIGVVIEESRGLTLDELAGASGVEPEWILRHVEQGCFEPVSGAAPEWRFGVSCISRARRMRGLERDFDAVPELAALFADMLEELDRVRAELANRG